MEDWMGGYVDDRRDFVLKLFGMIGLPLFMILMQPDKGTVLVVGITLVLMLYIAGVPLKLVGFVYNKKAGRWDAVEGVTKSIPFALSEQSRQNLPALRLPKSFCQLHHSNLTVRYVSRSSRLLTGKF